MVLGTARCSCRGNLGIFGRLGLDRPHGAPGVDEDPPLTHEPARGVSGGWVNDPTATSIRVTDPNGRIEEDTIEAGVAILIWNGDFDVWHATAELLDENGRVLRTGPMRPRG